MINKEFPLYVSAKEIIGSYSDPLLRESIQFCSIPHMFDKNFVEAVLGEKGKKAINEELFFLPFINKGPEDTYYYHENIRLRLVKEIFTTRYTEFVGWNKITISYITWLLNETEYWQSFFQKDGLKIAPIFLKDSPILIFEKQRYRLEIIYHLFAIDNNKWMPLFHSLFMTAYWKNDTNLCNTIFQMINEYEFALTSFNRIISKYFNTLLLFATNRSEKELETLSIISAEISETYDNFPLKQQIIEDIQEIIKGSK